MRNPEESVDRLLSRPPKGRAAPHQVEQQSERLKRHDDKSRQGNCNQVGKGTVKARFMEMIKRNWRKRDLND